jgi:hypothetical protein
MIAFLEKYSSYTSDYDVVHFHFLFYLHFFIRIDMNSVPLQFEKVLAVIHFVHQFNSLQVMVEELRWVVREGGFLLGTFRLVNGAAIFEVGMDRSMI